MDDRRQAENHLEWCVVLCGGAGIVPETVNRWSTVHRIDCSPGLLIVQHWLQTLSILDPPLLTSLAKICSLVPRTPISGKIGIDVDIGLL